MRLMFRRQTLPDAMSETCATVTPLSLATALIGEVNEKRIAALYVLGRSIRVVDADTMVAQMIVEGISDGPGIIDGGIVID
jgi:hypothetical protein